MHDNLSIDRARIIETIGTNHGTRSWWPSTVGIHIHRPRNVPRGWGRFYDLRYTYSTTNALNENPEVEGPDL